MRKLKTKRLVLRTFSSDDWRDLYEYMSNPNVVQFEPYSVFSKEDCLKEAIKRANDVNHSFWAVCFKESSKLIGHVYFNQTEPPRLRTWEIGYVFNPAYYKRGYATEACKRVLEYGFSEKNAHRIIAGVNVNNVASWRLVERLSMRREAHFLKNIFFKTFPSGAPQWNDSYRYGILSTEFFEAKEGL